MTYFLKKSLITISIWKNYEKISSKIANPTDLDVFLKKDTHNRLMKNSLIKIKQINSFDKRRFIKFIGNVTEKMMDNVDENLQCFLFGIETEQNTNII